MEPTTRPDLKHLIFLTANAPYLRGLTMLPIAVFMIAVPLIGHLAKPQPAIALAALFAALAAVILVTRRLNHYYDGNYGRVETGNGKHFPLLGLAVWGAIGLLLISRGRDAESAVWMAAFFWGIYMSSSGYRWFYLLAAIVLAAISPLWVGFSDGGRTAVIGLAFAVTGLMDHLLLRRLLPLPREERAASGGA